MYCKKCGFKIASGNQFCAKCGCPAEEEKRPWEVCEKCGAKIDKGSAFCKKCGAPVKPEPGTACSKCGAKLNKGDEFCSKCGTPVDNGEYGALCKKCGAILPEDGLFCVRCGLSVNADESEINSYTPDSSEMIEKAKDIGSKSAEIAKDLGGKAADAAKKAGKAGAEKAKSVLSDKKKRKTVIIAAAAAAALILCLAVVPKITKGSKDISSPTTASDKSDKKPSRSSSKNDKDNKQQSLSVNIDQIEKVIKNVSPYLAKYEEQLVDRKSGKEYRLKDVREGQRGEEYFIDDEKRSYSRNYRERMNMAETYKPGKAVKAKDEELKCLNDDSLGGVVVVGYSGNEKDIIIPETVSGEKVVGVKMSNDSIESIEFSSELYSVGFAACKSLKQIKLTNGITTVTHEMFEGCPELQTVVLPDTVKTIEYEAFFGLEELRNVQFPSGLEKIDEFAFEGSGIAEVKLPDTVTEIGMGAFRYCYNLRKAELSKNLTWIDGETFALCVALEDVKFPSELTVIDDVAFAGCVSLKKADLPDKLTNIGRETFVYNESLESVSFPESLLNIDRGAFRSCISLKKVELPIYVHYMTWYILTQNIGDGKSITGESSAPAEGVFADCTSLTDVSVYETGLGMFDGCTSLKNAYVNGFICEGTFNNCTALTNVTLGEYCSEISGGSFCGCTSLNVLEIPAYTEVGTSAFDGCHSLSVGYNGKVYNYSEFDQLTNDSENNAQQGPKKPRKDFESIYSQRLAKEEAEE